MNQKILMLIGIFLTLSSFISATPTINLLDSSNSHNVNSITLSTNSNLISQESIDILNSNLYVKCFTEGYSHIKISVENNEYFITIINNNIKSITAYSGEYYDYEIKFTLNDIIKMFNSQKITKLDTIKIITSKDIPLPIIMKLASVIIYENKN